MTPWAGFSTPKHKWENGKLRVHSVSDLHTDHRCNLARIQEWEHEIQVNSDCTDILIVAGDISANLEIMKQTLQLLKNIFDHVIFVPGNNEVCIH